MRRLVVLRRPLERGPGNFFPNGEVAYVMSSVEVVVIHAGQFNDHISADSLRNDHRVLLADRCHSTRRGWIIVAHISARSLSIDASRVSFQSTNESPRDESALEVSTRWIVSSDSCWTFRPTPETFDAWLDYPGAHLRRALLSQGGSLPQLLIEQSYALSVRRKIVSTPKYWHPTWRRSTLGSSVPRRCDDVWQYKSGCRCAEKHWMTTSQVVYVPNAGVEAPRPA